MAIDKPKSRLKKSLRREGMRSREINQWHEDMIQHFLEDQQCKREWIPTTEIAEWYSDLSGATPNKSALEEDALKMIERDLLAGLFQRDGRSQILFRCPGVSLAHGKMTPQWLREAIIYNWDREHGRYYLRYCLLRQDVFQDWCARHHLPVSAPRFQPHPRRPVVKTGGAEDETSAIKGLASYLTKFRGLKRDDAKKWCSEQGFKLSGRQFQLSVWPEARCLAGLPKRAKPGRKPKAPVEIVAPKSSRGKSTVTNSTATVRK
jgi:hypothetical protein